MNIKKIATMDYILALMCTMGCIFLVYVNNLVYKVLIVLFCLLVFIAKICIYRRRTLDVFSLSWFAFVFWGMASSFWSKYPVNTDIYLVLILIGLVCYSIIHSIQAESQVCIFLNSVVIAALILETYLAFYYGISNLIAKRMDNTVLNSNRAGLIFSLAFIIALFFFYERKKMFYLFSTIILAPGILLTGSKAALFQVIIMGMVFLAIKDKGYKRKQMKNILIIVLACAAAYFMVFHISFFYNIIGKRILDMFASLFGIQTESHSTSERAYLLTHGIKKFIESPIWGWGLDSFKSMNEYKVYAHSNLIELMADLGIIGTILFYRIYYLVLRNTKRNRSIPQYWRAFIYAYCSGMLIVSFTGVYYNDMIDIIIPCILFSYTVVCKGSVTKSAEINYNGS